MGIRSRFLDPDTVRRLGRVELKARQAVEGFLAGLHNSPYRGFSVEFAGHRGYVPGDDPRHIDWKVYARRERYHIKQYHEETNFAATILLDASESMTFRSGPMSKLEYGCLVATALSLIVLRQNDAAALGVYDRGSVGYLPPATRLAFIARMSEVLERIRPTGGTDTPRSLGEFGRLMQRKGIVVVVSDFLEPPGILLDALAQLRYRGHDVVALQVLDPHELAFPLHGHVRFDGLETERRIFAEPGRIRDAYLAALEAHLRALRLGCSRTGIDYRLASSGEPIDELLLSYLATRHKVRRVAR